MQHLGVQPGAAEGGCLACVIGDYVLAVPLAHVGRLVEYERGVAPPLAQAWWGGLGREGDLLFPSLALGQPQPGPRRGKGLLFSAGAMRFALEVDDVQGLLSSALRIVEAAPAVDVPSGWSCPAAWLAPVAGSSAAAFVLDVDAIIRTLRDAEPRAGEVGA